MIKGNSKAPGTAQKRFFLLIILMTAVLCAVMVLRTAFLLFHTTWIFYWKVFYQRGLPLVIGGSVLCLAGMSVILVNSRENLLKTLRQDHRKWIMIGILMLTGLAAGRPAGAFPRGGIPPGRTGRLFCDTGFPPHSRPRAGLSLADSDQTASP